MYRDEGFCDAVCKNFLGLAIHRGRGDAEITALRRDRPDLFEAYAAPLDAGTRVLRPRLDARRGTCLETERP